VYSRYAREECVLKVCETCADLPETRYTYIYIYINISIHIPEVAERRGSRKKRESALCSPVSTQDIRVSCVIPL